MRALFRKRSRPLGAHAALTGQRLSLRVPEAGDADRWIELRRLSRSFLEPWEPTWSEDTLTRRGFRRRLRRQAREANEDSGYGFLIVRRSDDALLGSASLSAVQRGVAQCCSLGYWIGAPFARQGYMTEALRLLLPYCFGPLGFHRVEAACLPHNEASRALLERLGFRREGYAHELLKIDGRWQDHLLYAMLQRDLREANGGAKP